MTRQRFFALKYVRLLTKTAAAQELGASTCWLLSLIACQEDVKGFTEPAKFYFAQLMPLCGFDSPKQLRNAIAKAVELGWLEYLPGSKGIPGRFSVRVPSEFADLAPFACDESSERVPSAETQTEMQTVMGALSGNETTAERQRKRKRNGNASLPITTSTPNTPVSTNGEIGVVGKPKKTNYPEAFEQFWKAFPSGRKQDKTATLAKWKHALKRIDQPNPEQWLIERAKAYAVSPTGKGEYVKSPEVWLNKGSYDDPSEAWGPKIQSTVDDREEYQNFTGRGAKRA